MVINKKKLKDYINMKTLYCKRTIQENKPSKQIDENFLEAYKQINKIIDSQETEQISDTIQEKYKHYAHKYNEYYTKDDNKTLKYGNYYHIFHQIHIKIKEGEFNG